MGQIRRLLELKAIARALAAVVFSLAPCLLYSQLSPVPYAGGAGPPFSRELVSTVYPGTYSSIRNVNFRNLRYPDLNRDGKPVEGVLLKNGHYQHDEQNGHQLVDLESIHYLKGRPSSREGSALVLSYWFAAGGSSNAGEQARVFTVSGGRLREVQVIAWSIHSGVRPASSFDVKTNLLSIRSDHYIPGDAHCCISAVDVVTFHWDGTHFVQTDIRTELSEYGRHEGKTLPQR